MSKDSDCIKLYDVGDVLYRISKLYKRESYYIQPITIIEISQYPHYVYRDDQGHSYFNHNIVKSCFKTEEEAENEIRRREKVTEKRKLLKEYESRLNEKLGISNHYIVK